MTPYIQMKRSFLLAEVLLAFSMLALFAPQLMKLHILHYRSQIQRLESFEYQRIADLSFAEIKKTLHQHSISWEKLPIKGQEPHTFSLSKEKLYIQKLITKTISRSYYLNCVREKKNLQGDIFRLYEVKVQLEGAPKTYPYRVTISKKELSYDTR